MPTSYGHILFLYANCRSGYPEGIDKVMVYQSPDDFNAFCMTSALTYTLYGHILLSYVEGIFQVN